MCIRDRPWRRPSQRSPANPAQPSAAGCARRQPWTSEPAAGRSWPWPPTTGSARGTGSRPRSRPAQQPGAARA
eukprot:2183921-Alexandrium_andersonii.AAC.1